MKRFLLETTLFSIVMASLLSFTLASYAQNGKNLRVVGNAAPNARGSVNIQVDRADRQYEEGDVMTIYVTSSVRGYLTLIYSAADGSRTLIVPNLWYKEAKIDAGVKRAYPDDKMDYHFDVIPPFGEETIEAIVSERPLTLPEVREATPLTTKDYESIVAEVSSLDKAIAARANDSKDNALAVNKIAVTTYRRGARPAREKIETRPGRPTPPPAVQPAPQPAPPTTTYVTNGANTRTEENRGWTFTFGVRFWRWAFNIGVSRYVHSKSMDECAKDAEIYTDLAKDYFGVIDDRNVTITGANATKARIERELGTLCTRIAANDQVGNVLYLTWSGHGARRNGVNYLIPSDGDPSDPETWISEDELTAWLRPINQKNCYVVIFLDACHSGGFGDSLSKDFDEEFDFMANQIQASSASGLFETGFDYAKGFDELQQCGIFLLCSSASDEKSYVRNERDSSIFTHALDKAIRASYPGLTQADLLPSIWSDIKQDLDNLKENHPGVNGSQKPRAVDNLGGYLLLRDCDSFPAISQ